MTQAYLQAQSCVPRSTLDILPPNAAYVLPTVPRLSAARFDGPCVSSHVHQFFEIVYIESGQGLHGIGNHYVPASAGDVFVIAPGEIHDTKGLENACKWVVAFGADALNVNHTDAVVFTLPVDMLLFLSFLRPAGMETERFNLPVCERPRWVERLHQLQQELDRQQFGYEDASRALLVLMLTDIARMCMVMSQDNIAVYPSRLLLARIFRYIEEHFCEAISLREVATYVGHAPAYLTDLVRRETGRTVLEWIVERRMAEVRYLLRETEQTIQNIAKTVGYTHTSHFITQFKRLHATTPNSWRSLQRDKQERKKLL